ncbi:MULTISPECIES: PLD nuclease N-terminal domain-containing protein [unclassified Nocardioides]|uniref:PLD nuclease N-terminal domain-containing protein n=1 Tax=unclassified Nocardioides TaxID=2615069 RepID=UPI003624544A
MVKLELLVGIVTFVLWVYCLVDAIGTSDARMRNLPKVAWVLLILLFPLVGSVAWLVAGRPQSPTTRRSAYEREQPEFPEYDRPGRAAAVDAEKDADFLREVRERAEAQRKAYEARKRREREADEA